MSGPAQNGQDILASARLAAILGCSDDAIVSISPEGTITRWNPGAERLLGYEADEALGQPVALLLPPERQYEVPVILERLARGEAVDHFQTVCRRKDGGQRFISLSSVPIRDAAGRVVEMASIARDISHEKRSEEMLRQQSQAQFRAIFYGAAIGMARLDGEGRFIESNPALQRMLDHSEEELRGRYFVELLHPDDAEAEAYLFEQMQEGVLDFYQMEHRFLRKDGVVVWGTLTVTVIRDRDGKVEFGIGMVEDTTLRRQLEEQVLQSQKMEAVGRLAGGVAHDFNNMLAVISGYSELLLFAGELEERVRGPVEQIQEASRRAAQMTRQLLAFSRRQMIAPRDLDLNELVSSTEQMLQRLIGEDIRLSTRLAAGLGRLRADPGQLNQVVMNLAVNARDAMPKGGQLTIETANVEIDEAYTRLHLDARPGSYVMLAVTDTGAGIDESTKAHIFDPFFTTKAIGEGTGLGLATVYGVVRQADGHITVESELGRGTTFRLYLPRSERPPWTEPEEAGDAAALRGTETILQVEDDELVRGLTRIMLEAFGYQVLEAASGEDALRRAAEHQGPIHLLFTDVVMPGMSGHDLARQLRPARPELRVLYTSGYTDDAVVRHGIFTSEVAFIQKPFTSQALGRLVREMLDGG